MDDHGPLSDQLTPASGGHTCSCSHTPEAPCSGGVRHVAAGFPGEPLQLNSFELLRGRREVRIRHGELLYRLRVTNSGKLILNK